MAAYRRLYGFGHLYATHVWDYIYILSFSTGARQQQMGKEQ